MAAPEAAPPAAKPRPLSRNVKALAAVSLLTDAASEMIYPLLPIFLSTVLGAPASAIGAIEGAAETLASMLKLASGWWSDKVKSRLPLVWAGYGIAAFVRPLIGLATSPMQVLAVRLADRTGKGIRSSPRDALLADSIEPSQRGRAFGFHRAGDNAGAMIGPLVAFVLLQRVGVPMRHVFYWAIVPGLLALLVLIVFVRDEKRGSRIVPRRGGDHGARIEADTASGRGENSLGAPFWKYLVVLLVFTLGNSTDAFLLLRASQVGVPIAMIPILWAVFSLVKAMATMPGGAWSDRIGRKPVIAMGWAIYAGVYLLFGRVTEAWQVWALFIVYALHFALTEGTEKALVADLVPASRRGTAYGWYNFTIGMAALPASLVFGLVWDRWSPNAAFGMGAAFSIVALAGLVVFVPAHRPERIAA
jgi:MFS family permease